VLGGGGVERRIIETGSNFHSGSNLMRDMSKWRGKDWRARWGAGVLSDMTHDRGQTIVTRTTAILIIMQPTRVFKN
jgi:hypothetical protein